uniref:ATPase, T2SS/T4P/T4SS family n=1 Tax=Providencia rettgeri TaxID=587 RepID=UPI003F7EBB41
MGQPINFIELNSIEHGLKALEKCRFELLEKKLITVDYNQKKYLIINKFEIDKLASVYMDLHYARSVYKKNISGFMLSTEAQYYQIIEKATQSNNNNLLYETSEVQKELESLLQVAVDTGASDLHITRGDVISKIEFRVNGSLILYSQLTSASCDELVFVLYNVEATTKETTWNRQQPQSANILYDLKGKKYRFRYAHFPIFGETSDCYHCVLRIIPATMDTNPNPRLENTGLSPVEIEDIKTILSNPYGAYFIAGTTGSGKSTTLKTVIEWLQINRYNNKGCFLTVEDPVEYYIYGTKQSSVLDVDGGGFHSAIKSALRRDPDVLMIGEIRDQISANALSGAVESGHYCFTTVHAGSIVTLLQRLSALGITGDKLCTPGFIAGLQCQKLMPILCPHCKKPEVAMFGQRQMEVSTLNSHGCQHCKFTGIAGRKLVVEYMLPSIDELSAMAKSNWLEAYMYWRKKRFIGKGIGEGFQIKEKTMLLVIENKVCYHWFTHEFGVVPSEDMEVIFEKIQ